MSSHKPMPQAFYPEFCYTKAVKSGGGERGNTKSKKIRFHRLKAKHKNKCVSLMVDAGHQWPSSKMSHVALKQLPWARFPQIQVKAKAERIQTYKKEAKRPKILNT